MDACDMDRVAGIPVTAPARSLLDLAAVIHPRGLRRAVGQAQSLGTVTVGQLGDVLARLGPCRGSGKLAELVARGPAPTRSELEEVVLALILTTFEKPDVNTPVWFGNRRYIPDFRYPDLRLSIEADSAAWHGNDIAREDDAERQAWMEAHGDRVIRVTWDQAIRHRVQTLARVDEAGAPRMAAP